MFKKAFSLIELLIVISIIGFLASIILVSLEGGEQRAIVGKAMNFSQTVRTSLGADLIGEWKFDEGSGTTTKDSSGNNNHGILVGFDGTPVSGWTNNGMFGKALVFDGSNDCVEVAHSSVFDVNQLTIELWIKTPVSFGATGWRALVSKQGTDRDYNWYTYSSNGVNVTYLHFSSARWGSSSFDLPKPYKPDTWHHVVVAVDQTGLAKYYSDGDFLNQYQGVAAVANNNYPLWIGRADNRWNSAIDEVRIYNRALYASEIQQLYAEGASGRLILK